MDGEGMDNNAQDQNQDVTANNQENPDEIAKEEALLLAQQTSLAETKKRRKE